MNWKDKFPKEDRYFETENGILYNTDCLDLITRFPDNEINCVITSPPYNVDLGNNKYNKNSYNIYKDNKPHQEYIRWLVVIFEELYDKLVKGGRLCINIGDGKNGRVPTHSDLIQNLTETYLLYSQIIWDKKQIGNRTAWGSFKSPSNVSYPTPFEYIILFAKETYKLQHKGETDLTKEEFIKFAYALWEFTPETKMKKYGHPAMFPKELPYRCIKMNTYRNNLVLDPFAGAGTTLLVAERLNRRWVGIELSKEYCDIIVDRIENEQL